MKEGFEIIQERYKFNDHPMINTKLQGKVFRKDQIIDMIEQKFVNPFAPRVNREHMIAYFVSAGLIKPTGEVFLEYLASKAQKAEGYVMD